MQIDWLGKVALCCFDAKITVQIGDMNKNTVSKIWHSPEMQTFRRRHISKKIDGICTNCLDWAVPTEYEFWYSTNELIENPQKIWYK